MDHLQGADPYAHHHADREGIDVEVRNDDQITLLAADGVHRVRPRDRLHDVREDIAVRQHRALRRPRRSAGVLQNGEIIGRNTGRSTSGGRPLRQEVGKGERAVDGRRRRCSGCIFCDRRDDDLLDRRLGAHVLRHRRERVERNQHPGRRIDGDDEEFARRVARVDVDDDGAEPEDRKGRDDVLRAVRQHDRDAVAFTDPQARQRRRKRVRAHLQIAERELRPEKMRCHSVRPVDGRDREDVGERTPGVRHARPHPVVVVPLPGARRVRRVALHAIVRPPSTTMVCPVM